MKHKKRIVMNNKGMTLVEVAVSFAIVTVIAVVIIVGFRTMGGVLVDSSQRSNINQQIERNIAMSSGGEIATLSSIELSDGTIVLNGSVREYSQEREDGSIQSFRVFSVDNEND